MIGVGMPAVGVHLRSEMPKVGGAA